MLWSAPSPSDGVSQASSAVEDLASTTNTLEQLQGFFLLHTFDTSGPFSDLFSVLLSCCKHLVDCSMSQRDVITGQAREIGRLTREVEELRGALTAQQSNFQCSPPLRDVQEMNSGSVEVLERRITELDETVHAMRQIVDEDHRSRLKGEREQNNEWERVSRLEADMGRLRDSVSSSIEGITTDVAALSSTVGPPKAYSDLDAAMISKSYIDAKVETLREEVLTAMRSSRSAIESGSGVLTGSSRPPTRRNEAECTTGKSTPSLESSDPNVAAFNKTAAAGVDHSHRPEMCEALRMRMDRLESRLEVLEVYAPHYAAVAARSPLLGIELKDESSGGVRVSEVFSGFAAHAAGVLPGDVVVSVNGRNVNTRAEMHALIGELTQENEVKRRLLMQMYYDEHSGCCRGEGTNERPQLIRAPTALVNSHVAAGRKWVGSGADGARVCDVSGMVYKAEQGSATSKRKWELPRLQFALHLKRNGFLHEVVVICNRGLGAP